MLLTGFLAQALVRLVLQESTFFYFIIVTKTFMNCGVVWWVPVSSLKLSSDGLHQYLDCMSSRPGMGCIWFTICFYLQIFINCSAILMSLMALQFVHVETKRLSGLIFICCLIQYWWDDIYLKQQFYTSIKLLTIL